MLDIIKLEASLKKVVDFVDSTLPKTVAILGSGWSSAIDKLPVIKSLDYEDIPALGKPGVIGHSGELILSHIEEDPIMIFKGRRHWYEGLGWEPVVFPAYVASKLKASSLILTCAAGSLNPEAKPGDLVIIDDHLNQMGANPLQGPHHQDLGPRFPDQTEVYDVFLREQMEKTASELGEHILHGIYAATPGPFYETPAEIAAIRKLGADLVGMSTVPEAALAHAMSVPVLGIACVSNMASGLGNARLSHDDVIQIMDKNRSRMGTLLLAFFRNILSHG